jgi:hypothetical protein
MENSEAGYQWLTSVILITWQAELRRIEVCGQSRQIVHETPSPKLTREKWTRGVAQVVERLLSSNSSPTKKE